MKKIIFFIPLLVISSLIFSQIFTKEEKKNFHLKEEYDRFNNRYIYTTKGQSNYMNVSLIYDKELKEPFIEIKFYIICPNWIFLEKVFLSINNEEMEFLATEVDRDMGYNPLKGGIYVEESFIYIIPFSQAQELSSLLSQIDFYQKIQLVFIGQEREKEVMLTSKEKDSIARLMNAYAFVEGH